MLGSSLPCRAPGIGRNAEAAFSPPVRPSFPAEKFGETNPYPGPSFPLAFSKGETPERTGRLANAKEEPSSKSASSGSLQPTAPKPVRGGKPRGQVGCRGTRLQAAAGKYRGRGPGPEDFPATRLASKSSLCMTPVPHRREFLC